VVDYEHDENAAVSDRRVPDVSGEEMAVESFIKMTAAEVTLNPSPIYPDWVLEGKPVARNRLVSQSADGTATTFLWDCTAGRFNWYYDVDETLYVIEGGVVIKDHAGATRSLSVGDTIFFPAGTRVEWYVENYVRKIAFCRKPLPRMLVLAKRGFRLLKRLAGKGGNAQASPAMFGNSSDCQAEIDPAPSPGPNAGYHESNAGDSG
jgi:uncharacterized cupin superfamily protein